MELQQRQMEEYLWISQKLDQLLEKDAKTKGAPGGDVSGGFQMNHAGDRCRESV